MSSPVRALGPVEVLMCEQAVLMGFGFQAQLVVD